MADVGSDEPDPVVAAWLAGHKLTEIARRPADEPPINSPASVVCPMCNAQPGRPCWDMRTAVPKTIYDFHRERIESARG